MPTTRSGGAALRASELLLGCTTSTHRSPAASVRVRATRAPTGSWTVDRLQLLLHRQQCQHVCHASRIICDKCEDDITHDERAKGTQGGMDSVRRRRGARRPLICARDVLAPKLLPGLPPLGYGPAPAAPSLQVTCTRDARTWVLGADPG